MMVRAQEIVPFRLSSPYNGTGQEIKVSLGSRLRVLRTHKDRSVPGFAGAIVS
jgi:hypothetical protein